MLFCFLESLALILLILKLTIYSTMIPFAIIIPLVIEVAIIQFAIVYQKVLDKVSESTKSDMIKFIDFVEKELKFKWQI